MSEAELLVCNFIENFCLDNWDKIDKERCDIDMNKEVFLKYVGGCIQNACWVITEVAEWGMDKQYLRENIVYGNDKYKISDFIVFKIDDKFVRIEGHSIIDDFTVKFTEKKQKVVEYWS